MHPIMLTGIYLLIFFLIILYISRIKIEKLKFLNRRSLVIFSIFIILAVFLWITFIPRFGQIGRLPAIQDWLDRFFSGKFPYNSPFTPSAYPFLFFLSIPFYLIGNPGYLEVTGLGLFLLLLFYHRKAKKEILIPIIILLMSPIVYYGIVVRDELFFNMAIAIVVIFIAEKYLDPERINMRFILMGIIFGLVLSTRSVAAIVYAVYLPYKFRASIPKLLVFSFIILVTFSLILLPFFIWDEKSFLHNGPIAIQSYLSHIPFWSAVLFILISAIVGWIIADIQELLFACGILLFIPVFLSMILQISQYGFYPAIVKDIFDPSYFIFCIPFLLLSLKEYRIDNFLGKIIED